MTFYYMAVVLLSPRPCKLRLYKRFIMDIKIFRDAVREYLKLCGVQGCHVKLKPSSSHALAVKRLLHPQRSHCCSQHYLTMHPWERVASDLFELNSTTYLLVVDYYSRYVEVQMLNSTSSASVITALKAIFSRHGIPTTLVSDNGQQYDSHEMK